MEPSVARRFVTDLKLMDALKIKGSFECPAHPTSTFCTCKEAKITAANTAFGTKSNFIVPWEAHIINKDDCFLYIGDDKTTTLFTDRKGGQTPTDFAKNFIKRDGSVFKLFKAAVSKECLVQSMLNFWADRAQQWRSQYMSKEMARAAW